MLLYRDSNDIKVCSAGIEERTDKKWRAHEAVAQAETQLPYRELVGTVTSSRAGLDSNRRPRYNKAQGKERHQLVQEEV